MTSRPGSEQPESEPSAQPAPDSPPTPGGTAVERIIERFGGIRPMAHKLDMPVTTVQGWKKRGAIPLSRHADLRAAAAKFSLALDDADLEAATPAEDRSAAAATTVTVVATVETSVVGDQGTTRLQGPESVLQTASSSTDADPDPLPETPIIERVPPAAAPPPAGTAEERATSGAATTVSVVALLIGVAALSAPWWGPAVPGWPGASPAAPAAATADPGLRAQLQQVSDRIARLEQRPAPTTTGNAPADLSAIIARLGALEQRPAPVAAPAAAPAGLDPAAFKALADRVGTLEARPAGDATLAADVAAIKQQVTALAKPVEAKPDAKPDPAAGLQALVLAAGQLRGALAGSGPFPGEVQAVKALGSTDAALTAALDAVAPYAAKGIPTLPQLADRLEREAGAIVRAEQRGEGGGWVREITGTLSTLVTVRRQGGDVVGNTADAIVARAQAALGRNDLKAAAGEMAALQGPAAQAAAGWLGDAKARLAADGAGQQLTGRAIALLSAASGGKVTP